MKKKITIYDVLAIGIIAGLRFFAFILLVVFYPASVKQGLKEYVQLGIKKFKEKRK